MLYLVVIMVASVILRRRAALTIAGARLHHLRDAPHRPRPQLGTGPLAAADRSRALVPHLYNLAVHLFGFYAVALLTSYLGESASRAEEELAEKTRQPRQSRGLSSRRDPVDFERTHLDRPRRQRNLRESSGPRDPGHHRNRLSSESRSTRADCSPRPSGSPRLWFPALTAGHARRSSSSVDPSGYRSATP